MQTPGIFKITEYNILLTNKKALMNNHYQIPPCHNNALQNRVKKREIEGIEPKLLASKVTRYCMYENNRNDLTFIHFLLCR